MNKKIRRIVVMGAVLLGIAAQLLVAFAAEFTVSVEEANIRSTPSVNSDTVGSTTRGRRLTVLEETEAGGHTWYKVVVDANTEGYIRGDLGTVSGTIPSGTSDTSAATDGDPSGSASIPQRYATVNQNSVTVRSGASTSHDRVASLGSGTEVILVGETVASDGRTWYEINATSQGAQISGYIRSDLLTPGELVDPDAELPDNTQEEEYPEDPTDVPESDNTGGDMDYEYEIRYVQNDSGGYDYYLYDKEHGEQWPVDGLLSLRSVAEENEEIYQEQIARQRMIIIVLAVIIIVLVLIVTILLFKIRDLNDDMEEGPGQSRIARANTPDALRRPATQTVRPAGGQKVQSRSPATPRPGGSAARPPGSARPPSAARPASASAGRGSEGPVKAVPEAAEKNTNTAPAKERPPSDRPKRPETAPPRKPQNFLADDDEFEFEFLNIEE